MDSNVKHALSVFRDEALEALTDVENSLIEINLNKDVDKNCVNVSRFLYGIHDGAKAFGLSQLSEHMNYMFFFLNQMTVKAEYLQQGVHHLLDACAATRGFFYGKKLSFKKLPSPSNLPKSISKSSVGIYQRAFNKYKTVKRSKGLVMIVDDEPDIIEVLEGVLNDSSFEVEKFSSPRALIHRLEAKAPDLIVCDYNMPEMNGVELLSEIRTKNGHTPVVFLSAFLSKEVCIEALKRGAYGFLEKPIDEVQLILMLETAIARSRATRLINRSNSFLSYHLNELYEFLTTHGKKELANSIKMEIEEIKRQKNHLDELQLRIADVQFPKKAKVS